MASEGTVLLFMNKLKIAELREPYNTIEDLFELAQEYKELKQNEENNKWKRARLAHEAAQKFNLKDFAKQTGENYDVLKNLSYVAGRYTSEEQSNYEVTLVFNHFMTAAKSDSRLKWLQKSIDNNWSAAKLQREMNPPKEKTLPVKNPEPIKFVAKLHSWEEPDPPDVLGDAFKPFIEIYNQLYLSGALPVSMPEALVLIFGQEDKWKLMFVEGFGYQMINLKAHNSMEDGPSQ